MLCRAGTVLQAETDHSTTQLVLVCTVLCYDLLVGFHTTCVYCPALYCILLLLEYVCVKLSVCARLFTVGSTASQGAHCTLQAVSFLVCCSKGVYAA